MKKTKHEEANPTLVAEISTEVWAWFNRHDAPWSPSDATVNELAFRIKDNILAAPEFDVLDQLPLDERVRNGL